MKNLLTTIAILSLTTYQPLLAEAATSESSSAPSSQDQPILIAQACTTCGADISSAAAVGSLALGKRKDTTLLTDSLWGNLILEMAYQRDTELSAIMHKMNILNNATLVSIGAIAAGTLAQGITSIATLNPPDGLPDSYVPGSLGIAFSCATIATFGARTYYGHQFQKHIHDRQMQLRDETEAVLAHLEHSNGTCPQAKDQLRSLIGERACEEWLQLWKSSHTLASAKQPQISNLVPQAPDLSQMLSDAAQRGEPGLNLAQKATAYVMMTEKARLASAPVGPLHAQQVNANGQSSTVKSADDAVPEMVH
ncbi:MAG TPA: hypothetical protein V6C81_18550 [Planktothrix sp.]|jgi:hypothetical protein